MATTSVVIDPVTRIEGHLRIQAAVTQKTDKTSTNPYLGKQNYYYEVVEPGLSSSTMVRGIEKIMTGRDPRDTWAFAQRICGVCTVVHGLTSVRAVEKAIGLKVPKNAELVRNMMIASQYIHDHVMHFYHLHALDWVDVASALSASAAATATLALGANPKHKPWGATQTPTAYFQAKIDFLKGTATRNLTQLGLFNSSYWGHPAYKLTPEQNLLLVCHYLEALAWAREVVKLHAVFGGRDPHPNLLVGGVPITLSVGTEGGTALNSSGFKTVQSVITQMKTFVDNVYLPDTLLLAGLNKGAPNYQTLPNYRDWANYGASGLTDASNNFLGGNFLCYGEFANVSKTANESITDSITNDNLLIPHGVILGLPIDAKSVSDLQFKRFNVLTDAESVTENVTHAWYSYTGSEENLHPSVGQTNLNYTGPAADSPGYQDGFSADKEYSWIKSPRWQANSNDQPKPMEVGPLAHILMMYARNKLVGDKTVRTFLDNNWISSTTGLGLPLGKLNSTFGRIFSRTLETKVIADAMQGWYDALVANKSAPYSEPNAFKLLTDASSWTTDKLGVGFTEAPRGALGHWVKISKAANQASKVTHYQCIVASQWNAGPRDGLGQAGPYETSLKGHKLADPTRPVEILRTIHSFDPCIGCAVHIVDSDGEPLVQVKLNHA